MKLKAILYFLVGVLMFGAVAGLSRKSVPEKNTMRDDLPGRTQTSAARPGRLPASPEMPEAAKKESLAAYGRLPLSFEVNRGQADGEAKFLSRGAGHTVLLNRQAELLLASHTSTAHQSGRKTTLLQRSLRANSTKEREAGQDVLRMQLIGANSAPLAVGLDELPGKSNYFKGNDPAKWLRNVSTYAKVKYQDVYPGIDLVYYGNQRQLEYDFVVSSGADPGVITLNFQGAKRMRIDRAGDLVLHLRGEKIRLRKPHIYQESDGTKHDVNGGYILKGSTRAGFQLAAYDPRQPLVIDPTLVYSTYLGGTGLDEGSAIAVDGAGNAYLTGTTSSTDFPIVPKPGAAQAVIAGGDDVYVTKLNAAGTALIYSTFLGGSGTEDGNAIAIDAAGNAYVTGSTDSPNFPVTAASAYQTTAQGVDDVFVTKLNPTGTALLYSTYLGGASDDVGKGIQADSSGNAYVTGSTESAGFPFTAGAFQTTLRGASNAFVAKVNTTASGTASLVYSTFLGGPNPPGVPLTEQTGANAIAIDSAGNAYVTGKTESFPVTTTAFQATITPPNGIEQDAFFAKLNATGKTLLYATYLGGLGEDGGNGIAVDSTGKAYIVGSTESANFPTTAAAFQKTAAVAGEHAFVAKFDPTASGAASLVYSTYLAGDLIDEGVAIAVDASGNAYVTGATNSTNFPTSNCPIQPALNGTEDDGYITKLNAAGSGLLFSTYLGGTAFEDSSGIALDSSGNVYVTGETGSSDFPMKAALQPVYAGSSDSFVTKIDASGGALSITPNRLTFAPQGVGTTSAAQTVTLANTSNQAITTSITITGDFAQTNTCGSSLAAPVPPAVSTTCTVSITSTPTATGARPGTLTIAGNACGGAQTLVLAGVGIDFSISAAPPAITIRAGETATYTVTITPASNGFPNPVTLSASGQPASSTVTFTPPTVTPGSNVATSVMKVITTRRGWLPGALPNQFRMAPPALVSRVGLVMLMVAMLGLARMRAQSQRQMLRWAQVAVFLALLGGLAGYVSGCNGGFPGSTTSVITITGTSGALKHSTTVTLTVQ